MSYKAPYPAQQPVTAAKPSIAGKPINDPALEEQRKKWRKKWGTGSEETPYKDEDYRMLENAYDSLAEDYKGGVPKRADNAIIGIAKATRLRDKAMEASDAAEAKKWQEVIDKMMTGEALKVGDAKPIEKFNISSLAARLEERGLMDNGILILDKVIDYIQNDHGTFHMSKDAMDLCMLSIYNATMFNNGLPEVSELPESVRVQNRFGEFLPEPTQEEKNAALEFGMQLTRAQGGVSDAKRQGI